MKTKLTLIAVFFFSLFISCSEDAADTSADSCAEKLEELSEIVNEKTQNYVNNQSEANCNALKTAHTNF